MLWDVLGCTKFDVVFNVSLVVLFFQLLGSFALFLRCSKLFYMFCVVVDSVVFVSNCQPRFHCFSSR